MTKIIGNQIQVIQLKNKKNSKNKFQIITKFKLKQNSRKKIIKVNQSNPKQLINRCMPFVERKVGLIYETEGETAAIPEKWLDAN